MADDAPAAMVDWKRRFGPTFTVTDLTGKFVFTSEPKLVRQIFSAPSETFDGGLPETLDVLLGPRSIALAAGDAHREARKLLTPSFCKQSVSTWAQTIANLSERLFGGLVRGQEFGCRSLMEELTTRVIVRIVFGAEDAEEEEMFEATREVMNAIHPSFLVMRQAQRSCAGLLPYHRYKLAVERLDGLLYRRIARARSEQGSPANILSVLARSPVTDAFVRDNLYTLLAAGYETTAYTLTWAAYFLQREPAVLNRLRAELDGPGGHHEDPRGYLELPYLNAVIDESLRFRPPAPYTTRRLARPWTLGKWSLPAGVLVAPASYLLHHDASYWGDPERFRPSRFLERRPSPLQYLPFGGGAHRCLGAALSKLEATVALGTLVRTHSLELREPGEVEHRRISLTAGPKQDIRMVVSGPAPARVEPPRVAAARPSAPARCPFH
jgi:cytochrome P450